MNRKITPLTGFIFLLILSFGFQSCLSPRDSSIKEWEKYEWKTIAADGEETSWIKTIRRVRSSRLIELRIKGELNVHSGKAIRILQEMEAKEGDNLGEGTEYARGVSVFCPSPEERNPMNISWKEKWGNVLVSKKGDLRIPIDRGFWEFVSITEEKCLATYSTYAKTTSRIRKSRFNEIVASGLSNKFRYIEDLASSFQ